MGQEPAEAGGAGVPDTTTEKRTERKGWWPLRLRRRRRPSPGQPAGARKGDDPDKFVWSWHSERRQRLNSFIYATRCQVDLLSKRTADAEIPARAVVPRSARCTRLLKLLARLRTTEPGTAEPITAVTAKAWLEYASCLCKGAEEAAARGRKEKAWALVLDARRSFVPLLSPSERDAVVKSVKAQSAKARTGHWRRVAIANLLGDGTPDPACLMEAVLHLDTVDANKLRGLRVKASELAALAGVLLFALGGVLVVMLTGDRLDTAKVDFGNARLVALAPLFGIIGACLSGIERTQKRKAAAVPDERASAVATTIRPITGAAGGFLALAASQSGVLGNTAGAVLLGAFASGFSERFVLKLAGVDDAGDAQPAAGPDLAPGATVAPGGAGRTP